MNKILSNIRKIFDKTIVTITSTFIIIIVLGAVWQVFTRYILGSQSVYTEELLRFMLVWIAFLSAAYVFGLERHLAITFFKDKLKGKVHSSLQLFIDVVVIIFALMFMVRGGWDISMSTMSQTSAVLGVKMGYVYLIMPVSGVLIIVYQLLNILDRKFRANNHENELATGKGGNL